MKIRQLTVKTIPLGILCVLLAGGCVEKTKETAANSRLAAAPVSQAPAVRPEKNSQVYKGKVVGRSNKAKIISLETGTGDKAQTIAIKFDDDTVGLEHAAKGHGAIIAWEKRGNDLYATTIKPKLAKMPAGVAEISVDEVKALIDKNEDFELIDSRPAHRYASSHLPGAISIPVCEMQELIGLLPRDKNKLLVFYCGGPT